MQRCSENRDARNDSLRVEKIPEYFGSSSGSLPNLDESSSSENPSTSVRTAFSSLFAKSQADCSTLKANNENGSWMKKSTKRPRPGTTSRDKSCFRDRRFHSFFWTLEDSLNNDQADSCDYGCVENLGRQPSADGSFVWAFGGTDDSSECDNDVSGTDRTSEETCEDLCDEIITRDIIYDAYEEEESNSSWNDDTESFSSTGVSSFFSIFGSSKKISRESGLFSSNENLAEDADNLPNDGLDTIHRGETIEEDHEFIFGLPNKKRSGANDTDITMIDGTSSMVSVGCSRSGGCLGGGISSNRSRRGGRRAIQLKHEKHEKQLSNLHKKLTRDELLGVFERIDTTYAATIIINDQIGRIKKEMKKNGFVTDLALLQLSRGIVEASMIREIEKGEARKHLSSSKKNRNNS